MIYSIIFLLLAALSYWYWRARYIPAQVARNLAAFRADGANDSLQRGFHERESWRRVWVGLACCVVPAVLPALVVAGLHLLTDRVSPAHCWGCLPAFLSVAALLAGVFARDFTPKLNAPRIAAGEAWLLSDWYASPASKSWPDAAAWVRTRRNHYLTAEAEQAAANDQLKIIVTRAYRGCLLAAGLLAVGAVCLSAV